MSLSHTISNLLSKTKNIEHEDIKEAFGLVATALKETENELAELANKIKKMK